jgi:hypothetical protein
LIIAPKIYVIIKKYKFELQLNNSKTSKKLLKILPLKSTINKWGDEIYFSIPLKTGLEKGVEVVDIGTAAFWPPGNALCIFFGRTPASVGDKPQAASPVTVLGNVINKKSIKDLKNIKDGDKVEVKFI